MEQTWKQKLRQTRKERAPISRKGGDFVGSARSMSRNEAIEAMTHSTPGPTKDTKARGAREALEPDTRRRHGKTKEDHRVAH